MFGALNRLFGMSNTVHSDSDFRDAFIEGAARAFFVSAYADFCENQASKGDDADDATYYISAGPGEDWADVAPANTPPNAYALAGELWAGLYHLNGAAGPYTLVNNAQAADGAEPDAEEFGHYLAMEAMGHGVSWFDDHARFDLKVPHMECSAYTFDEEAYRA